MRRMKAFLIAVVLSIVTIIGIHYYGINHIAFNPHKMGVWADDAKFLSREGIIKNQDKNTIVIFGSSEFENAKESPYHICNLFQEDTFTPMVIGRGHSQSLQHAITLASIGNELTNKKVVFIVSPQWFQRKSVLKKSYAVRFSESNYVGMLTNEKIPDDLKKKMIKRTGKLLKGVDDPTLERVELYNRIFITKDATLKDKAVYGIYKTFNQEKDRLRVIEKAKFRGIEQKALGTYKEGSYDWAALEAAAEKEAKADSDNPLYMNQEFYEDNKKLIEKNEGSDSWRKFRKKSKEYDDLRLFLDVCKSMEIEPMIIIMPNNGYWCDNTDFPKAVREKTYQAIKDVADEYQVKVTDLSSEEYNPYFFMDCYHVSGKGWVKINEAIYEFYKQDEEKSPN